MENENYHIAKWRNLKGTEFFSEFIVPGCGDTKEIPWKAWVLSDPMIVKDPIGELPTRFFGYWRSVGSRKLVDFLLETNQDLSKLYDLILEPHYGFEYGDTIVTPVCLGKRIYPSGRIPKIEVWAYHEDTSTVDFDGDMLKLKRTGFQRLF